MTELSHVRLSASAIVQRDTDHRFLIVEELINDRLMLDVPGGTWEAGETLVSTSIREAAEEASIQFIPKHYLGCFVTEYINVRRQPVCNVRMAFSGVMGVEVPPVVRDVSTHAIYWMNFAEILENRERMRSSATLRCVSAFLNGNRYPLELCDHAVDA